MDVVGTWTGRAACALQAALRMTNEAFAERLGISVRTVATWHADPEIVPRSEMQQILDTTYERAGEAVQRRFGLLYRSASGVAEVQALRVAIAVVLRGAEVLLVCRRGDGQLRWQFPAGVVKPGGGPEAVAVAETHAETGVHCAVRRHLGNRLHPVTGVQCAYYLADYLAGEATNLDQLENMDVAWVPLTVLSRFIPPDTIYPPILNALEAIA
jgi:8-oxo-dGTP diphosphatase